jgi:hypothetical protein
VDNRTIRDFLVKSAGKSYMSYKPLPTTDLRSGQRVTTYLSSLSDDELNEAVGVYQRLSTEPNRIEFWYFRLSNRFLRIPGRAFERLIPFRRRIPGGLEPFLGRSYWCLHIDLVRYINRFVSDNPSYRRFFEYVRVPDEIFFQTIVANSPLIDRVINSDIMFQQWVAGRKGNLLDETDLERVFASGRLFARKFDTRHAVGILDAMDARVGQETG